MIVDILNLDRGNLDEHKTGSLKSSVKLNNKKPSIGGELFNNLGTFNQFSASHVLHNSNLSSTFHPQKQANILNHMNIESDMSIHNKPFNYSKNVSSNNMRHNSKIIMPISGNLNLSNKKK